MRADKRLKVFGAARTRRHLKSYFEKLAPPNDTQSPLWPELEGCLCIAFTSRTGSTFLARELESQYVLGRIGESFNPPQLATRAGRAELDNPIEAICHTVATLQDNGWFAVKAGGSGLSTGEYCGFFERYLSQTQFLFVLRRNIVAQCISQARAKLSGRYHSTQQEARFVGVEDYKYDLISRRLATSIAAIAKILRYIQLTDRPYIPVFYEEFETDLSSVAEACDAFGIPRRPICLPVRNPVGRLRDLLNEEWEYRFRSEMRPEEENLLNRYQSVIDGEKG